MSAFFCFCVRSCAVGAAHDHDVLVSVEEPARKMTSRKSAPLFFPPDDLDCATARSLAHMVVQVSYSSYICGRCKTVSVSGLESEESAAYLVEIGHGGDVDRVCRQCSPPKSVAPTVAARADRRTDDCHVLDLFGDAVEGLVVAHAVWLVVVTEADDDDARLFCEDGLVDMPPGFEPRQEDGHRNCESVREFEDESGSATATAMATRAGRWRESGWALFRSKRTQGCSTCCACGVSRRVVRGQLCSR